nr:MAG TPA: hypothetical protein [Caudoviricetes sp.]
MLQYKEISSLKVLLVLFHSSMFLQVTCLLLQNMLQ